MNPLSKSNSSFATKYLSPILIIEGGALMALQIVGGKALTLYYGIGIQVWTSTIVLSMVCLAIGYSLGAKLSGGGTPTKSIRNVLVISAIYILMLGLFWQEILSGILMKNLMVGSLITAFVVIGPCTILFGTIGPLISQIRASALSIPSGQAAGGTFLMSTFGGVVFVMLFGLYLIPEIGISSCFMVIAFLLAVAAIPVMKSKKLSQS